MELTYTVVFLREQDGRYSVIVPALKGCTTWGANLPEAMHRAEEVIALFIEALQAHEETLPRDARTFKIAMGDAAEAVAHRVTVHVPDTVAEVAAIA
jgi:predicted RNase H-like HicB family nuclease